MFGPSRIAQWQDWCPEGLFKLIILLYWRVLKQCINLLKANCVCFI
jgi:hypothetical protein